MTQDAAFQPPLYCSGNGYGRGDRRERLRGLAGLPFPEEARFGRLALDRASADDRAVSGAEPRCPCRR